METTKKTSDQRANELNKIPFLVENSIVAVNTQWSSQGETWAELYSRKTKKRVRISTSKLFDNKDFLTDRNNYFQSKMYATELLNKI